jgi:hypothetical protein
LGRRWKTESGRLDMPSSIADVARAKASREIRAARRRTGRIPMIREGRGSGPRGLEHARSRVVITPAAALDWRCRSRSSRLFEPVRDDSRLCRTSRWLRAAGAIALAGALVGMGGCVYETLPCALELEEDDLVITELRGPQEGTRGNWIELYNASGEDLDLQGLRGTMQPLKGSEVGGEAALTFLVRESLPVPAGGYVVLGALRLDASRRPEVDYSINSDLRREPEQAELPDGTVVLLPPSENADPYDLLPTARIRLWACERLIEELSYTALPPLGTFSYDGSLVPDADDNDDLSRWCTDDTEPPAEGPQTATGRPGSGGEANRPCP